MIIKLSSLFSLLVLFIARPACSEDIPLNLIPWKDANQNIEVVKQGWVFSSKEELTPEQAWQRIQKEGLYNQEATVGFTENVYWLAFSYKNQTAAEENKILEIDNPQIDYLWVYELDSMGRIKLFVQTGDKLLFSTRPIPHRNFAIPLRYQAGATRTLLIKIDKRNSSLSFPTYLWNESAFFEKSLKQNLWYGFFFGLMALCMCYALMAFIFLRKTVYGWYFLMVFFSAIYLFTALGLAFKFIYPDILDLNSYLRIYIVVAGLFCVVNFSKQFLDFRQHLPVVNRFLNYLQIVYGLIALISIFTLDFMTRYGVWTLSINYLLCISALVAFIYGGLKSFHKQKVTVLIYFSAWGILICGYAMLLASEFGLIPVESIRINPVLIGFSLEMFLFSIGLTYQIGKVYEERNQLSLSMARVQKELLKAYVEGTEKERQRISRELHDDIGSRLGSLKRFISSSESNRETLNTQIDILCRDVRNMSHQLAPTTLGISDFQQLIHQLLEDTAKQEKLETNVQFFDIPKSMSPETSHHLFRVTQEAINNVLKHSQATELDLQFFAHEDELVMTIEDNGKGFDLSSYSRGIGLLNIKARIESLNGIIEISSTVGLGTSIMVRIPILK